MNMRRITRTSMQAMLFFSSIVSVLGQVAVPVSSDIATGGITTDFSFDTRFRTQNILSFLQGGGIPLEILEEKLPDPSQNGQMDFSLAMKAWDGKPYQCTPLIEQKAADAGPEDEKALTTANDEPLDKRLSVLQGTCAILTKDWWSYEWCHRKEVRQFHLNINKKDITQEPIREPDWSLGVHAKSEIHFYNDGKVRAVTDHFEGGQHCDETKKGRQTKVHFYCCTSDKLPKDVERVIKDMQPVPFAVAQLAHVQESTTCHYEMIVCTPLLCYDTMDPKAAGADSKALRILEPMQNTCVTRHEGYWSYEFCYKKGIRQFHTVAMRDSKGRTFSKVDNEFAIGTNHIILQNFNETEHIVIGDDENDPTYFELEYTGGTECDLTGEHRATSVHFICGEGVDQFVSVKEDRSCHYKAVISTPRLCRHPAFKKQLPTTHKMKCEPVLAAARK